MSCMAPRTRMAGYPLVLVPTWYMGCTGPALTKTPLARVGSLGIRNVSKEYEDAFKNNKTRI